MPFFYSSKNLPNFLIKLALTKSCLIGSIFYTWWKKKLLYFYELADKAGNSAFCYQHKTVYHPHFSAKAGTFLYKWKLDLYSGSATLA